jgi:uroporphyrin-III C-methyltransferase/precorrin-2 dehydrogenase/sirohydrochlorin ferrochelatase
VAGADQRFRPSAFASEEKTMSDQVLLPVFLKLEGRRVVLVGGGGVAAARLGELTRAGAHVTVVAPEIGTALLSFGGVIALQREFVPSDLDGAWFAVAAATPAVNRQVADAAEERRIFVNAVDDAERASAYMGGVLRRGGVTIAVSTEGCAPALAGLLREGLEAAVPEDIEAWVDIAHRLRQEQRAAGVPMVDRRPRLLRALNQLYAGRGVEVEAGR